MTQPDPNGTDVVPRTTTELKALERLPAPLRVQARQLAHGLKVSDGAAVLAFGSQAQSQLNAKVDPVLKTVATKDTGEAGKLLTDLLDQTRQYDPSALARGRGWISKIPFVGKKISGIVAGYEKIGTQIDSIVQQLQRHAEQLRRDINILDGLYAENEQFRQSLMVYIAAGEIKLEQLAQEHTALLAKAQTSGLPEDAQAASDMQSLITRLERKVHNLKLSALISLQTGPQIRLVQAGDQALAEKMQTSILTTVPLWKRQMVIAIALANQQKGLEVQKAVTDTTNELIKRNATALHNQSVGIAEQLERGVVDIETLQHAQQQLLATIEDTLRVQQEAKERRKQELVIIEQMQDELNSALTRAQNALPQ